MTTADPSALTFDAASWVPQRQRFRFAREIFRRKIATIAIIYLLIFYGAGVFAPWVAPHDPNQQNLSSREFIYAGPSSDHWFGTDSLGRDQLSRVIYSARTTIIFTVMVILGGSLFIGLGLGLLAGYRGGWIDTAVLRVGETLGGIPTLILILAISAAFRTRLNDLAFWLKEHSWLGDDAKIVVSFTIIILVSVPFAWIGSARIVRGQALAIRESEYIAAAESIGAGTWRIVWYHLFPGVLTLWVVGVSGGMAGIAMTEVGLSYLGLGIEAPGASFGTLIQNSTGIVLFEKYPHMLIGSAAPVVLFAYAWNLLGDALVDIVQPRHQRR